MEEKKTWIKVTATGMIDGVEFEEINHEGSGVIVLADTGENIACSTLGAWGPVEVATAIGTIKGSVGTKMFKTALEIYLAHAMAEAFGGKENECAAEEAENEQKAAEAAGEGEDGEEA
jgi:hypothetical protein